MLCVSTSLCATDLIPKLQGRLGSDAQEHNGACGKGGEAQKQVVVRDVNEAVNNSQADISPRQAHRGLVLNIQQTECKHNSVELSRLLEQVVVIVGGPLHKCRQLLCFLLFGSLWVEGDTVLGKSWSSTPIQQAFHGEGPGAKTDERSKERQLGNRGRHDEWWTVVL